MVASGVGLFAGTGAKGFVAAAATDFDVESLDFLVQCGKRNKKPFGGFGLIPVGALEHIHDDAALDLIHDLKQRRVRVVPRGAGAWTAGGPTIRTSPCICWVPPGA